jgi:hypothetical protein
MKTMKTLALAGFAALSLGVGVANAQSLAPSSGEGAYFSGQGRIAPAPLNQGAAAEQQSTVQFGASDRGQARPYDSDMTDGGL